MHEWGPLLVAWYIISKCLNLFSNEKKNNQDVYFIYMYHIMHLQVLFISTSYAWNKRVFNTLYYIQWMSKHFGINLQDPSHFLLRIRGVKIIRVAYRDGIHYQKRRKCKCYPAVVFLPVSCTIQTPCHQQTGASAIWQDNMSNENLIYILFITSRIQVVTTDV